MTATSTLLADVALGQVGIVLSYESTRLSRNCTDWYPLLDLCAYNQCLIADRDGVYDAATPNGRLLLGMKGIVSEVELHTLRGRLIAGVQQKAAAGRLGLSPPRRAATRRGWSRSHPSPTACPACHYLGVRHVSRTESRQSSGAPLA